MKGRRAKFEVRSPKFEVRSSRSEVRSAEVRSPKQGISGFLMRRSPSLRGPGKPLKRLPSAIGPATTPLKRGVNEMGGAAEEFCCAPVARAFQPATCNLQPVTIILWLAFCLLAFSVPGADTNSGLDVIPPLRPPQPEIAPSFWEAHGWLVVLGGGAVLALAAVIAWWLNRPKPPVAVAPAAQARRSLEPLRRQPEDGLLLSRVSQILRHYIAATFALPAGELTTTEFCYAITTHAGIGPQLAGALATFLRDCDERKFAASPPTPPLEAVAQALRFVAEAEARRASLAQPSAGNPTPAAGTPPRRSKNND